VELANEKAIQMLTLTRLGQSMAPRTSHRVRPFFASSTDHTRLLKEAEVHCLEQEDGVKEYILAAGGSDPEMVKKVRHLHLARLCLKDRTMYGARVLNRTLGTRDEVCGPLVDAALVDAGPGSQARSTLHGLSEWVLRGLRNEVSIEALKELSDAEVDAVSAIAEGPVTDSVYETGRDAWEELIGDFLNQNVGDEATLYQSKGAVFVQVEHHSDDTDYADTCGGATALFAFK